jgi:hypothetical protein
VHAVGAEMSVKGVVDGGTVVEARCPRAAGKPTIPGGGVVEGVAGEVLVQRASGIGGRQLAVT